MSKELLLLSTHNSILGMLATLLWQRRALHQELYYPVSRLHNIWLQGNIVLLAVCNHTYSRVAISPAFPSLPPARGMM